MPKNKVQTIEIYGKNLGSVSSACDKFNICAATFHWWRKNSDNCHDELISDQFISYLKEKHFHKLVLFRLQSLRLKANCNKEKYVLSIINKNNNTFKSVEEYLKSLTDIKVGLFSFSDMYAAAKSANTDINEIAYLISIFEGAPINILLEISLEDCPENLL